MLLRRAINQPISVDLSAEFKWKYEGWRGGYITSAYFICLMAWEVGFMYELLCCYIFDKDMIAKTNLAKNIKDSTHD